MGNNKSEALPAFHALTGCDTTSCFSGKGKKTARSTWKSYPEVTPALRLSKACVSRILPTLERFVVLIYDRCSTENGVNSARQTLFAQKNREIENIPPTKDALPQHVLYQCPKLPSPNEFGWMKLENSTGWQVNWMD